MGQDENYAPITSHSEAEILKECISLMHAVVEFTHKYMDFIGFVPENEEEEFHFSMNYFKIVQRLFLWNTRHSGGTSTCNKCRELGVDPFEEIEFGFDYDPDYDPY